MRKSYLEAMTALAAKGAAVYCYVMCNGKIVRDDFDFDSAELAVYMLDTYATDELDGYTMTQSDIYDFIAYGVIPDKRTINYVLHPDDIECHVYTDVCIADEHTDFYKYTSIVRSNTGKVLVGKLLRYYLEFDFYCPTEEPTPSPEEPTPSPEELGAAFEELCKVADSCSMFDIEPVASDFVGVTVSEAEHLLKHNVIVYFKDSNGWHSSADSKFEPDCVESVFITLHNQSRNDIDILFKSTTDPEGEREKGKALYAAVGDNPFQAVPNVLLEDVFPGLIDQYIKTNKVITPDDILKFKETGLLDVPKEFIRESTITSVYFKPDVQALCDTDASLDILDIPGSCEIPAKFIGAARYMHRGLELRIKKPGEVALAEHKRGDLTVGLFSYDVRGLNYFDFGFFVRDVDASIDLPSPLDDWR